MSEYKKGHVPWHNGKKLSEEHRRKISEANKKFHKENPDIWKGRGIPEETRKKISETIKRSGMFKGEKHPQWKGGCKYDGFGYILIWKPNHPRVTKSGYVKRSHLVAEKELGRYLYPDEITHHKNGIKDDDRPEKIEVTTQSKHTTFHMKKRWEKGQWRKPRRKGLHEAIKVKLMEVK